jgi:hypothetical protein
MQKNFDLGREALKWVAIITMTVDHIGAILFSDQIYFRIIGRISFPLFCYLLILGIEKTRNVSKYFIRLLFFALVSQIPFSLALGLKPFESLNIFFTLALGVWLIHFYKKNSPIALFPIFVSIFINFDYRLYGLILIACMQILHSNIKNGIISIFLLNALSLLLWEIQIFSIFALPFIVIYKTGFLKMKFKEKTKYPFWRKYFFYTYYPLHLYILYLIKLINN